MAMTWLDVLNYLKETPYYLLEKEVSIHTSDTSFELDEFSCPSWYGQYWDPNDGMYVQMILKEVHWEDGRIAEGPKLPYRIHFCKDGNKLKNYRVYSFDTKEELHKAAYVLMDDYDVIEDSGNNIWITPKKKED